MQNECIALNPSINIGQIPMAKAVEALFLPLWPLECHLPFVSETNGRWHSGLIHELIDNFENVTKILLI